MSSEVVVYVLTALGAVVVVLTRLRLRGEGGAGRLRVGRRLLDLHTGAGVAALVVWTVFLLAPPDSPLGGDTVGIIGLGFWWLLVVAGIGILVRWLPSRGRHASAGAEDSWSEGPGLSLLAHLGTLAGVCVLTWAYLTSVV
ncbi:hypothetical protein [Nocardioides deserti]|uniref:DUF5134 domain-containing protein n=1 Tax=Nocardioides deserti TaxID=1588644 RepID=A0ABR6U8M1_9ACTN|nr:hypothetical protein [Nocardioides deserti]MBC2960458.1 hypothetical protein [Nocardioides deserti]GGO71326.1 hypothetical protein GCM10012276_12030 [Nocardioides deserti]